MRINDVIKNLHNNGACKLYFPIRYYHGKKTVQKGMEFKIGENGQLEIRSILDIYDKTYWDGKKIDRSAILKETITQVVYSKDDLDFPISAFVYCTVMRTESMIQASDTIEKTNIDDTIAINQFYQISNQMLSAFDGYLATEKELSNIKNPIFQCVKGGQNSFYNILIKNARNSKSNDTNLTYEEITAQLSVKHRDFSIKIDDAYRVWELAQGFDREEYENEQRELEIEDLKNATKKHLTNEERREKQLTENMETANRFPEVILSEDEEVARLQSLKALNDWMDDICLNSYQTCQWIHFYNTDDNIYIDDEGYNTLISRLTINTSQLAPEFATELSRFLYTEMANQLGFSAIFDQDKQNEHFTYNDRSNKNVK